MKFHRAWILSVFLAAPAVASVSPPSPWKALKAISSPSDMPILIHGAPLRDDQKVTFQLTLRTPVENLQRLLKEKYQLKLLIWIQNQFTGEGSLLQVKKLRDDHPEWMERVEVWSWDLDEPGPFTVYVTYSGGCFPAGNENREDRDAGDPLGDHYVEIAEAVVDSLESVRFSPEKALLKRSTTIGRELSYYEYTLELIGRMIPVYDPEAQDELVGRLKERVPELLRKDGRKFHLSVQGLNRWSDGGGWGIFGYLNWRYVCRPPN